MFGCQSVTFELVLLNISRVPFVTWLTKTFSKLSCADYSVTISNNIRAAKAYLGFGKVRVES